MSITNVPFFSPRSITGCSFWFDGTDSSTITLSSGSLTQWNDKSGNGKNFTAVSGFANATVSTAFQNGLNVFNFSGNGLYRTPAGSAVYPQDAYIIVALKSTTSHVDVLGMGDSTTDNFNSLTFAENVARRWQNGSSGGSRLIYSPTDETSTSFLLMQWSIANGNFLLRRNGTQLVQGSQSYGFSSPSTAILQIGYRHADTVYGTYANFSGYIGEIAVFNSQLGTTDRQNVESYLAQKWGLTAGLPAGHPGIISTVYKSPTPIPLVPIPYTAITYAFAPTQITGCSLWLDGADPAGTGVAPALNASISTWVDKSGLGNNATNQGGAGTVTYTTAGLVFNGSGYFYMPGLAGNIVNKAFVIFVVETLNTTNGTMLIGDDAQTNYGTNNVLHIMYRNSTNFTFAFYANDLEDYAVSGTGTRRLWTFYLPTASNRNIRRNGGIDVTHGNYDRLNYWTTPAIGRGFGGYNYVGTMSEVIIYPSDIGLTAIRQVEAYLAQKWGLKTSLAAAHPGLTTDYFNHQSIVNRAALTVAPKLAKIPIILSGLIIYYTFDNALNDFYNVLPLNLTGSISYVTGRRENAISLTNTAGQPSANYVSVSYALPTTFTVSLWFQTSTPSSTMGIFYAAPNISNVNGAVHIYIYASAVYCAYNNIVNNGTGYGISANTWYHALLTYNSGSSTLYVNGSQSGNTITGTNSKSGITIGGSIDGAANYPYTGYVDDLRIYNRILTGTEITAIYNNLG